MRLRIGALPARIGADVRALLPLPRLPASDRQRLVLNALIETDRIELISGAPAACPVPTDSGRPHDIYRCPDCATPLWSDYGGRPWVRFVRVGALDDAAALTPDVHIFTRSKLPWVRLPEGAHAFDVYYEIEKEWPRESLARRKAASLRQ